MTSVIVGCGNPRCGDDGVGLVVARSLSRYHGPDLHVVQAPIAGFGLIDIVAGYRRAVVVDAGLIDPPGRVMVVTLEQLVQRKTLCLHDVGPGEALLLARNLGLLAGLWLVVVTVGVPACGSGLSQPVADAVKPAARLALSIADGNV